MNYPGQQQGYGRPRRKPNFFLLLMLGAMAFFLFTQYQSSKQQQAAVPDGSIPNIPIPDFSNDGPRIDSTARPGLGRNPQATPSQSPNNSGRKSDGTSNRNGDWSIDTSTPSSDAAEQRESTTVRRTDQGNQEVSRSGDWEIEEGASTPSANGGDSTLRPSAPKKTRDGDWAIEEVQKK